MRANSLKGWLEWLEQCHPLAIDLGLDRIRQVAERLQLLTPSARVITIAGTNGKGSCAAATAALLRAAGLRVGVYTSPHLLHYCERISINGTAATEQEVCAAFERIYNALDSVSLTYFEFGTLAALDIFNQHQVDVMVLEVGLGGRLDAVNIIDADIAVITSIDLDHQDWLGNDRESIGREKAGVIRAHKPFVCADPHPPESVINAARSLGAPLFLLSHDFGFSADAAGWRVWSSNLRHARCEWQDMPLPFLPLPSLAAAIQVTSLLELDLSGSQVSEAMATLRLPGRFQQISYRQREFILDVAHNPAATAHLAARIAQQSGSGRTLAIVAMMADKDRLGSLGNMAQLIDAWYLVDLEGVARAASPAELAADLRQLNLSPAGMGSIEECIALAVNAAGSEDRILVFGSFFTVAGALTVLNNTGPESGGLTP